MCVCVCVCVCVCACVCLREREMVVSVAVFVREMVLFFLYKTWRGSYPYYGHRMCPVEFGLLLIVQFKAIAFLYLNSTNQQTGRAS
jgi:hypothetical protein